MNTDVKTMLRRFISQRMEMGENEWYFPLPSYKPPVSGGAIGRGLPSGGPVPASGSHDGDAAGRPESCDEEEFSASFIEKQASLNELKLSVCVCMRCPLGKTRTNFVFGDGNPQAGIMFIGEAPGAEEDRQGHPFVGRAGQLLTRMIEAMKLHRKDVYIGNLLKCRPPNNRDPQPSEIEQCEPILIRQIEIIKPEIICALGRVAAQTLLRTKATLGSLRGKIHDYHGVKFIVTYHPAALLRNPNFKPAAWEDLKFLRREYDEAEL